MKRLVAVISTAIIGVLVIPTMAQTDRATKFLIADGSGLVILSGSGQINMSGTGFLYILDRAGDAEITVTGEGARRQFTLNGHKVIRYAGFNGTAKVSGSDVLVSLKGIQIHVEARGTGRAFFRGRGNYRIQGIVNTWDGLGFTLPYATEQ